MQLAGKAPGVAFAPEPTYRIHRVTTRCVEQLRQTLVQDGLDALLTLQSQKLPETPFADLKASAQVQTASSDIMDFDLSSAYAIYFREIFFHLPYLIGDALQTHQKFEEAKGWYEYIFDPLAPADATAALSSDRFWHYQPFRNHTLEDLAVAIEESEQYQAYEDDPFDPFAIAEFRLGAYEKALVMQYIDNLLDWGDSLFALDGWENLNAATTLYVLAAELLGPPPKPTPVYTQVSGITAPKVGNASREVHQPNLSDALKIAAVDVANPFFDVPAFFFLPENDQFAGYWDKVAQRLYRIRHCMNLQGVVRQIPTFDPAIDPRQLLRALAAGASISEVTASPAVTVPHYRFAYLLERARQVTAELKQLGGTLLSALEKQDAEHLAVLHNTYEAAILNLTTLIKQKQQEETQHTLEGLQQSLSSAQARYDRYQGWSSQYLSPGEQTGLSMTQTASNLKEAASLITALSGIGYGLPNIYGLADGGMNFGKLIEVGADTLSIEASILEWLGQMALTRAQYDRRKEDWQLQADLANYDVQQINAQIAGLNVRRDMVDQELAIHQLSIIQNQEIDQFYRQKFTTQELYQWMVSQLGTLYFQTYQLALDLARMTERAFQYERNTDASYVNVNAWDGLRKGLLVGEALALNLNQLENAYIEQNARELEIEKTISLLQFDPQALIDLKTTGTCKFDLSEQLFDYDFPGHYCRRIKSLSISIPAVVGPYQNIQATLTQRSDRVLIEPDEGAVKALLSGEGHSGIRPDLLRSNWRPNQQVAISRGVDDSGMFQLDFRDERYWPFEGTGVISSWELKMPKATNRIDFSSISDVIIHLRYTALDGGEDFRSGVIGEPKVKYYSGLRFLSLRQECSNAWQKAADSPADPFTLDFIVNANMFPVNLKVGTIALGEIVPLAKGEVREEIKTDNTIQLLALSTGKSSGSTLKLNGNLPLDTGKSFDAPKVGEKWSVSTTEQLSSLVDIVLILPYTGQLDWPPPVPGNTVRQVPKKTTRRRAG